MDIKEINNFKPNYIRGEYRVFDWEKAVKIIREKNATEAAAGILEDWMMTAATILENGKPELESGAYLLSTWGTPAIEIGDELIRCFKTIDDSDKLQSRDERWQLSQWPNEALKLLRATVT